MILLFTFILFILMAFHLLQALITETSSYSSAFLLISLSLVVFFFGIQLITEWHKTKSTEGSSFVFSCSTSIKEISLLIISSFLTFYLNYQVGLGSVMAASLVGIFGALTLKNYTQAIYCGAFIGMACSIIYAHPLSLLLAGLISGTLFVLAKHLFTGFGGRLGFIAFSGCFITSLIIQKPLRVVEALDPALYPRVLIYIILTGMVTYGLHRIFKLDTVLASALVGLTMALIHPDASQLLVVAAYCASFAGMVTIERVRTYSDMFFITLVTSLLYIIAFTLFDGAGGRLGAIAFLASVSGVGMLSTIQFLKAKYWSSKKRLSNDY